MQVKALNDCFVEGTLRRKDEKFEYTGPKNEHLERVKAEAPADPKQAGTVADKGE